MWIINRGGEAVWLQHLWVRRLIQHGHRLGTLEPHSITRHDNQRTCDDADEPAIRDLIRRKHDATLAEVAEAMGKPVYPATVSRTLKRLNLPRKKVDPCRRAGSSRCEGRTRVLVRAGR